MRIGILTQPLYCNYGGLVQCYALQEVLKRKGHEAIILQREWNRKYTFKGACIYYAKHIVKLLLGKQSSWHYYVSQEKRNYIARETHKFVNKYITPRSRHCYTTEELKAEVERLQLDVIVVGSDQVWRPDYSPCQPNYFLDFLPENSKIKRVSYAASFGGDNWNGNEELTQLCATLLQRFDAVSVRESSGIGLCERYFHVKAVQVLDPTMLLEKEDYISLIENTKTDRGDLFCYVLDRSNVKRNIILDISRRTGMKAFESMPELNDSVYNLYGEIEKVVYPPVENWLSAFMEAEMVITDSFHGTVFSIIFNKPFWVIGNEGRGMARFESLLSLFGLENRLISFATVQNIDLKSDINWQEVNKRRKLLKTKSIEFINKIFS